MLTQYNILLFSRSDRFTLAEGESTRMKGVLLSYYIQQKIAKENTLSIFVLLN